ncbi:MAG TPA: hypothetical protein P5247_03655 [Candidatus Saccharimonadales bacterium]|nr:hypothetical protein [Candidatus Saccharimonadales bacterium]
MEEEIKEALEIAKSMVKSMIEQEELISLTAELSKSYLSAYMAAGFTRKEAVQMVVALTGKSSK